MDRVKQIWYLSPMRAAKVQASLRIRAVSPEPPLLAHRSSESRGTLRQKARSLAPLNGWACAVKICHDGMLEDTNSLDGAQILYDHTLRNVMMPSVTMIFSIEIMSTLKEIEYHLKQSYHKKKSYALHSLTYPTPTLPYPLPYPILRSTLSYLTPYITIPSTLPYPLPYHTLSYPTLPYPTLTYQAW